MSKWSHQPLRDRLEYRIHVEESGRWSWTGCVGSSPYGLITLSGKITTAHRAMYTLVFGAPDDGLVIDHLCKNTLCVNPYHLEAVTQRENCRRGKGSITHCKRGHLLSGDNCSVGTRGERRCKTCARDKERARRVIKPWPLYCKRGHELFGPNVAIEPNGSRRCRACCRERQAAKRASERGQLDATPH